MLVPTLLLPFFGPARYHLICGSAFTSPGKSGGTSSGACGPDSDVATEGGVGARLQPESVGGADDGGLTTSWHGKGTRV